MRQTNVESLPAMPVTPQAADALRGLGSTAALPATDRTALAELGLVSEDGELTPAGRRLRDDLRHAALVLLYSTDFATDPSGLTRRARLYVGAQRMMYLGIHPAEEARQTSELLVFPADAVPLVLAGWGRLQPMLNSSDEQHGPIRRDAFRRRCHSPAEPVPGGAEPALAAMWAAPWRPWGAQCDAREIALDYVDIQGFGTYLVRHAEDATVMLAGRPSSLLWGDLQGVLRPLSRHADTDW
ncbi:MAG: hypothetical protein IPK37_11280 [Austwickia sp.]|jgi:hypothetical protein|nr:MAG: hypothetical protein IPK37_11280 [Austwickia sp.]